MQNAQKNRVVGVQIIWTEIKSFWYVTAYSPKDVRKNINERTWIEQTSQTVKV